MLNGMAKMILSEEYKKRLRELSGMDNGSDLELEERGDQIYFKDSLGGYGFLVKRGDEINIVDWHSVPRDKKYGEEEQKYKRRGFAKKVIQAIKDLGYKKFNINMPSAEANLALDRLSQTGVIKPVSDSKRGLSDAPHYTQYIINENIINENIDSIDIHVLDWLNKNYGNLHQEKLKRKSLGKEIEETVFLDYDFNTIMSFEAKSTTLGISRKPISIHIDEVIWNKLQNFFHLNEEETESLLKKWLGNTYGIKNVEPLVLF